MKYSASHKYHSICNFSFMKGSPCGEKRNMGLKGFMLIELIVATLIASLIAGILLMALSQGNRSQLSIDNMIDVSERIGIVTNQLEKDLAGAFVPTQAEEKKTADDGVAKADQKSDDEKKSSDKKDEPAQKSADKKEQKPIEKIFYNTNKDGMLDTLTFVTNNPLVVFVGKDVGVVKPKVVRVQYTCKPEPEKKGSYALFRQESMELDLAEYKNVRPYEVIGGIKSFTATFTARIEKKQEQKAAQNEASQEKPKISYEYKVLKEWVSEQKKDANKQEDKDKPEFPRIPHSVEFKITLWDKQDKKDTEFTIVCEIPVDSIQAQQKDKKEPAPPKKDETKQPAPGSKPAPGAQGKQGNSQEVVVYNSIESLTNTLNNLTKLLKQM